MEREQMTSNVMKLIKDKEIQAIGFGDSSIYQDSGSTSRYQLRSFPRRFLKKGLVLTAQVSADSNRSKKGDMC